MTSDHVGGVDVQPIEVVRSFLKAWADNDVPAGCEQLLTALAHHDDTWEAYRDEQRRVIGQFLPDSPGVTQRYARLLADLLARPIA